ncbi:hypothetical protein H6802_04105 [Candidatus Nomurabacteria bacterium]|uniref:Phage holin family protein n=1 Tax=candidate division WWE3 bacterium TaxID=2053526 RepID=A0A955IVX9_UNCKA|nr:hypothetical protein [candidate division WWE3 bacterium]MCB9824101.1 hypothetical protein [Candidatus Nomurabacteria bacterium]MCB9826928.1 hypothetical protein [Candidatus Nomurabacteria bacterium]MCB9828042.1 hypothetical protein [Candidatus Nomurabacteria bacterium]HXK52742.1 hypothetical protein [bacterium]
MIKKFITFFIYCSIGYYVASSTIGGIFISGNRVITSFFVVFVLTFANMLAPHVFAILPLPKKGFSAIFLSLILNVAVFQVFIVFLPNFRIVASFLPELIIFGFVLPSKHLNGIESLLCTALVFTITVKTFLWLGKER